MPSIRGRATRTPPIGCLSLPVVLVICPVGWPQELGRMDHTSSTKKVEEGSDAATPPSPCSTRAYEAKNSGEGSRRPTFSWSPPLSPGLSSTAYAGFSFAHFCQNAERRAWRKGGVGDLWLWLRLWLRLWLEYGYLLSAFCPCWLRRPPETGTRSHGTQESDNIHPGKGGRPSQCSQMEGASPTGSGREEQPEAAGGQTLSRALEMGGGEGGVMEARVRPGFSSRNRLFRKGWRGVQDDDGREDKFRVCTPTPAASAGGSGFLVRKWVNEHNPVEVVCVSCQETERGHTHHPLGGAREWPSSENVETRIP